jgi:hypothetical protein
VGPLPSIDVADALVDERRELAQLPTLFEMPSRPRDEATAFSCASPTG